MGAPLSVTAARTDAADIRRSQVVLLSAQGLRLLLFLALLTLLGRWLTSAEFGFVAMVLTLFQVAYEVLDVGTTSVTARRIAQQPGLERQALVTLLCWRRWLALVLAGLVLAIAAIGMAGTATQRGLLVVVALALPLLALNAYHVVFQTRQAYGRMSALGLASQGLLVLACMAMQQSGAVGAAGWAHLEPVQAVVLLIVLREAVQLIGSRWLALRLLGGPLRPAWLDASVGPLLRRASAVGLAGLAYKLSALSGAFFVWQLDTAEALGSFHAAHRLLGPLSEAAWLIAAPLLVSLSPLRGSDAPPFRALLTGHLRPLLAVAAILALSASYLAPTVLQMLYGTRFVGADGSAVPLLAVLGLAGAMGLLTPMLVMACLAQGRDRWLLTVAVSGLLVGWLANALLVPTQGALGAMHALCVGEAMVLLLLAVAAVRCGDLRVDAHWLPCLLPALLLLPVLEALRHHPRSQLFVTSLAMALAFAALRRRAAQTEAALSPGRPS